MENMNLNPESFTELSFDYAEELYRNEAGQEVRFPKLITVRIDGEEGTHKLSYTRAWMGVSTSKPLPILRIDGEKYMLDGHTEDDSHIDFSVATEHCIVVK